MNNVRFQVLKAASIKITAFWEMVPCNIVEVDRRFRHAYKLPSSGHIALIMEEIYTSEKSVDFFETTLRYIPEGCHLLRHLAFGFTDRQDVTSVFVFVVYFTTLFQ
jgi:hypothetical protein